MDSPQLLGLVPGSSTVYFTASVPALTAGIRIPAVGREKHRTLSRHSLAFCSLSPWALNTTYRLTALKPPDQSGLQSSSAGYLIRSSSSCWGSLLSLLLFPKFYAAAPPRVFSQKSNPCRVQLTTLGTPGPRVQAT